jgi:polyhydroxybutyrate depolymerase
MTSLIVWTALLGQVAPDRMTWTVDGTERQALVFVPAAASQEPSPVVFAFHGHGGRMQNTARTFQLQKYWPEAIVVYMQGLPTAGRTDPEGKQPGWQHAQGDEQDRDLKFFDAVLETLKSKYKVDMHRIYATGHSNGGGFTYLLWGARPDLFAALAPCAAGGVRGLKSPKPCPIMHIAGRNDAVVSFRGQELTIEAVRKINHADQQGREWAKDCTLYPSSDGAAVVTLIHDGDHTYPSQAPELIVKFFKENARK